MRILALLAACLVASAFTFAKEKDQPAKQHTLTDFKLGRPVMGKGSLSDAKGKGVVIEAWGVRCPPCIASLPKLQALSEKHKDKVLFFGAESQGHERKEIEPVIKKAGVSFPISTGLAKCPIEFSSIPRAFVFDATGKLIYDGSPKGQNFEDAVERASASVK
jgi:thiol-disulfide isomerase/thioredoxin